jgi:TatA/E family protein of Tat protein translocase
MNILGMGPLELLVILGLALIVFGPEKLPEIGGQIGRALRDFRRTTGELSEEFNRNLKLELEERKAQTDRSSAETSETSGQPVPYTPPEPPVIAPPAEQQPLSPLAAERQADSVAGPAATAEATHEAAPGLAEPASDGSVAGSTRRADIEPPY